MANPKIVWNNGTSDVAVDFPSALSRFWPRRHKARIVNQALSGVIAWHSEYGQDLVDLSLEFFTDETFRRALESWLSHCRNGGRFAFAEDSDLRSYRYTIAAHSVGDTVLAYDLGRGGGTFSAGDIVVIVDPVNDVREEKIIGTAGIGVVTVPALEHDYSAGAMIRHRHYWPDMYLLSDPAEVITYNDWLTYTLQAQFAEYVLPVVDAS